jgi:hypothetical protein
MKKGILISAYLTCSMLGFSQGRIIDITSLGAKGDGITINTSYIQSAIEKVASSGGGKVVIPKGKFITGSIVLKSGVEFNLDENAVLLGSLIPGDYKGFNRGEALILADGQKNISISGMGTIDGQGRKLMLNIDSLYFAGGIEAKYYNLQKRRPYLRPKIIEVDNCKNVLISGITLRNSSFWVQNYALCENLVINNIHVESDVCWNNDGLDIVDSKNVRITNCFVNSADDGICFKSESAYHWNDSIFISNCTVRSSASAIKFGTASSGGFKNVKIENIKIFETFRSAIALELVDGGIIENVEVDNVVAINTGNAVFIRLGHRNEYGEVGAIRNIRIRNMKVQVPWGSPDLNYEIRGPDLPYNAFHNTFPASITGIPGHFVENILLENIEISYPGRGNEGMARIPLYRLNDVPEIEIDYPEFSMFGELPSWGFYIRHVKGLIMKNITLVAREKDFRPAFVLDDVKTVDLELITISKANSSSPVILNNVTESSIKNVNVPGFNGSIIRTIK